MNTLWDAISQAIEETTSDHVDHGRQESLGGGCINQTFRIHGTERDYFVKINDAKLLAMFDAEAKGLQAIARTETLRVPEPICWGTNGKSAYLVLEHLQLGGGRDGMEALGKGLAAMHHETQPRFGWEIDNTIGSTPQINTYADD